MLTRGFVRNAATTPLDLRLADLATVTANADGSARVGVLGPYPELITASATALALAVPSMDFVLSKGRGDGVVIIANLDPVDVPFDPAPATNSRIDVLYVKHNDDTTGDPNALPVFGILKGNAASSPVEPTGLPTGALRLATLRIYAGTTTAVGGSNLLTNVYQMTAMRGGVVPFRTQADLFAWANPPAFCDAVVLARVDGRVSAWEYRGTTWGARDGSFVLVGGNKGDTVTATGTWASLNTAASLGQNVRNDGYIYGAGDIDVPIPDSLYHVSATVAFTGRTGGDLRAVRLYSSLLAAGGDFYPRHDLRVPTMSTASMVLNVSGLIPVATAFRVQTNQDSGANLSVEMTSISAHYVGPL